YLGCSDVVHAGVAENIARRLLHRYILAPAPDDDAELALEGDFATVCSRPLDALVRAGKRRRRLDQEQRVRRCRLLELGGKRVKVVPKPDDLGRRAGCHQLDALRRNRPSGRAWPFVNIAGVLDDPIAVDQAEADLILAIPEAHPVSHRITGQMIPAPRAHLYFAPSTATGISVE